MASYISQKWWGLLLLYVGGFLTAIAMVALYSVFRAPRGGLTLVPLLSLPVAIIGGAIAGYGVADIFGLLGRQPARAIIAVVCATAAWTGQIAIWSWGVDGVSLEPDAFAARV